MECDFALLRVRKVKKQRYRVKYNVLVKLCYCLHGYCTELFYNMPQNNRHRNICRACFHQEGPFSTRHVLRFHCEIWSEVPSVLACSARIWITYEKVSMCPLAAKMLCSTRESSVVQMHRIDKTKLSTLLLLWLLQLWSQTFNTAQSRACIWVDFWHHDEIVTKI